MASGAHNRHKLHQDRCRQTLSTMASMRGCDKYQHTVIAYIEYHPESQEHNSHAKSSFEASDTSTFTQTSTLVKSSHASLKTEAQKNSVSSRLKHLTHTRSGGVRRATLIVTSEYTLNYHTGRPSSCNALVSTVTELSPQRHVTSTQMVLQREQ
jgi:hypothetical protein